uniref:Fibrinogen alpha chain, Fibrinogen beta Coagulation, Disease mutation, Glycoprotein n=1 Tax=Siphoviridae sp. ctMOb8 TaxID=2825460 RepID=A0A8S5PZA8_9CAUD|nr:MAG TPA: Fibrinogen alpha chain, Fibrinogen beta Coagulation, Disease mutation, Glycoprotein [Siphoviridae sp. ctMOb8]
MWCKGSCRRSAAARRIAFDNPTSIISKSENYERTNV